MRKIFITIIIKKKLCIYIDFSKVKEVNAKALVPVRCATNE